jgi:hypothetical protein
MLKEFPQLIKAPPAEMFVTLPSRNPLGVSMMTGNAVSILGY